MAVSNSTAERLCYTKISQLVSGIDATKDFSIKKVYLWASTDTHGKLQTPHDRMQPAFFGTYKTVAVPFGSRVIAQLPREHRLVKNGSFGDRLVEGTYL